ncbi:hypothetical protein Xph01_36100 [Micromonospora phaseoli]|nr:hypothetical protein Xph01_36100 [Micromonospora phaseoli]
MARCRPCGSRPTWRCRACGSAWPCGPAKLNLLAEYGTRRTDLLVYLATRWEEAVRQLTDADSGVRAQQLHDRFTAWVPTRPPHPASSPGQGGGRVRRRSRRAG